MLRYIDINCRQHKHTFGLSGFWLSVEKSPELDAPNFLYLRSGKWVGVVTGIGVSLKDTCAGCQQF